MIRYDKLWWNMVIYGKIWWDMITYWYGKIWWDMYQICLVLLGFIFDQGQAQDEQETHLAPALNKSLDTSSLPFPWSGPEVTCYGDCFETWPSPKFLTMTNQRRGINSNVSPAEKKHPLAPSMYPTCWEWDIQQQKNTVLGTGWRGSATA